MSSHRSMPPLVDSSDEGFIAKTDLENHCFTMRKDEKLKEKVEAGDKEKIEAAVRETLDWQDKNDLAEKDECVGGKRKGSSGVANPIMMKVYQVAVSRASAAARGPAKTKTKNTQIKMVDVD